MKSGSDDDFPIRVVLFDFGGVLAEEGFREDLQAIAEEQGIDPGVISEQGMDAVYDSGYVTGDGTEAEFWALLRQRTGLTGEDELLANKILARFITRSWMLELVRWLRRQGYITAILSDQTAWLDELDKQLNFFALFDHVFVSYRLGKGKRDPSLFEDVIHSLGIQPQQAVFVDDDSANIERARSRGLLVIHYKDRSTFESALEAMLTNVHRSK